MTEQEQKLLECKTCCLIRPSDEFSRCKRTLTGRTGSCKSCIKNKAKTKKENGLLISRNRNIQKMETIVEEKEEKEEAPKKIKKIRKLTRPAIKSPSICWRCELNSDNCKCTATREAAKQWFKFIACQNCDSDYTLCINEAGIVICDACLHKIPADEKEYSDLKNCSNCLKLMHARAFETHSEICSPCLDKMHPLCRRGDDGKFYVGRHIFPALNNDSLAPFCGGSGGRNPPCGMNGADEKVMLKVC